VQPLRLGLLGAACCALVIATSVGSGCSSFGNAEGDGAGDAGGAGDGAASLFPPCRAATCEDFETNSWKTKWGLVGTGALGATEGSSTSPKSALDFLLKKGDAPTILVRPAGPATAGAVVVSVYFMVIDRGDGEVDFINLVENGTAGANGINVTHNIGKASYALEYPGLTAQTVVGLAQSFGESHG